MSNLLQLIPEYRDYVWGGYRLRPGSLTAEAWIVYEGDHLAAGLLAGKTLAEAVQASGTALLGEHVVRQTGNRFPLLIKLLDCNQWLSVQVHPNDAQAAAMEGPGQFGKTEAWHILDAAPGAQLIAGLRDGTTSEALANAIRNGGIVDLVQYHAARAGDTIFMPAGTLHALGPGFLVYEVQQTSNLTYRIFDWDRPASAGRALHIEQSVAVTDSASTGHLQPLPDLQANDRRILVSCPYFVLELVASQTEVLKLDTLGVSFHALTVINGRCEVQCGDDRVMLNQFETTLVPAASGSYQLRPIGSCRALKASVEPTN